MSNNVQEKKLTLCHILPEQRRWTSGGARGVMVIVVGNGKATSLGEGKLWIQTC